MFNAILIIFVASMSDEISGGVNVVPFENMEQCEAVIEKTTKFIDNAFSYNDGAKKFVVTKAMSCFEIEPGTIPTIPATAENVSNENTTIKTPKTVTKFQIREHKRWN